MAGSTIAVVVAAGTRDRRGELYMAALYFRVDNMILNMISIKDNGDMAALMFLFPSLYIFILRK